MSANDFYNNNDNNYEGGERGFGGNQNQGNEGGFQEENDHEGARGFGATLAGGVAGFAAAKKFGGENHHGLKEIGGAIAGAFLANKAEDAYENHKRNDRREEYYGNQNQGGQNGPGGPGGPGGQGRW
ncbi:hypothetical protein DASC09_008510 [Saccharomycopsis crataegensis]|uniref:Glycine zipper 2TM domain-containing protein n=1 Tax=Saccharomycopsis crataegensis TaxID=43959 RepID=A0AAV5QG06_9ASCO|nr:hypothetical protein DASC09_008510 [Saccharomycopsis crataegensis]